jgi:hypothetical protein
MQRDHIKWLATGWTTEVRFKDLFVITSGLVPGLPAQWVYISGLTRPEREAYHSLALSGEVKNAHS